MGKFFINFIIVWLSLFLPILIFAAVVVILDMIGSELDIEFIEEHRIAISVLIMLISMIVAVITI